MSDAAPRVGIVTDSLSSSAGGMFFAIRDTANRQEARGDPQRVFGLRDAAFDKERDTWRVREVHAVEPIGRGPWRFSPALFRVLRAADLEVLHLHGIWNFASFAAYRWRVRTKRPLLISTHGMLDPGALAFSSTKKRVVSALYERANLHGATAVHALNAEEAAAVRAFGITAPIAIIPNGVSLPDLDEPAEERSIDPRAALLFLARLHPKKGVEELVAAWRRLLDRAPAIGTQWRLVLAGWDDSGMLDRVRRQVATLDLADHVELPGPLFGVPKHAAFAAANAFVLPSRSEGLPVAVLEAWAYGLPVFMTSACNLPGGFSADAAIRIDTDPESLAATLADVLPHADRLRAMGANGRALVERNFGWNRVVEDYSAMYRWLAGSGAVPSFVQPSVEGPA